MRLLDLSTNRVWVATTGVENKVKDNYNKLALKPDESTSCFVLFGPVDAKQVTVFVPQAGFVTVDVVDKDAPTASGVDLAGMDKAFDSVATIGYSRDKAKPHEALEAPVTIERFARALDNSTSTLADNQKVTITLASDVTFASDSADLTPQADAQLQTVAGKLSQYPDGGTLTIVGHTDDIQDDAYNQTLSEKRANAVKTRLDQLTKLDKWKTSVSGKGESEPKIKDTTDQARAANRRVEITLTPTGGSKEQDTTTLVHVTRNGGYLLGQVQTTTRATKDSIHNFDQWLEDKEMYHLNSRGEDASAGITEFAADGLTLLAGNERIYPADYLDAEFKAHVPLTELGLIPSIKAGTITVCVVWPDPGGDTVTLDHAAPRKEISDYAYRLTDIPIKNS